VTARPTVGVLALQGDIAENQRLIDDAGGRAVAVRRESELAACHALVLPGGESTTIIRLLRVFDLLEPLRAAIAGGLPVLGSCAGMILLADRLVGAPPGQQTVGGMDITVRRNAFGRQVDSFETDLLVRRVAQPHRPMRAVFIRAPWVEHVGERVEVLATVEPDASGVDDAATRPVVVSSENLIATSFHPELTGDARLHEWLLTRV
jgi:5'-phosphate synthase pdxT subunit